MSNSKSHLVKLIKHKMLDLDMDYKDLSKASGIKYDTLLDHMKKPGMFRVFEIKALNKVLGFSDEEFLLLIKGE